MIHDSKGRFIRTVSRGTVVAQLMTAGNTFFSVDFHKKNGELRRLTGRRGVNKFVTGEGLKYAPSDYDLMTVYDTVNQGYRMISIKNIQALRIRGEHFHVESGECTECNPM